MCLLENSQIQQQNWWDYFKIRQVGGKLWSGKRATNLFPDSCCVQLDKDANAPKEKEFFCCVKETRTTWRGNPQNIRLKELFLYLSLLSSDSYVEKVHSEAQNEGFQYIFVYILSSTQVPHPHFALYSGWRIQFTLEVVKQMWLLFFSVHFFYFF